jgi:hypothetical protein
MSASTVHVEPNPKGRWIVRRDDEREPLSEHESATEAAHIARELAQLEGASLVLLHDRYARIHRLHRGASRHLGEQPNPRGTDGGSPSTGKTAASGDAE